jgi:hypothetical protein
MSRSRVFSSNGRVSVLDEVHRPRIDRVDPLDQRLEPDPVVPSTTSRRPPLGSASSESPTQPPFGGSTASGGYDANVHRPEATS